MWDQFGQMNWLTSGEVRPYVFIRKESHILHPGSEFDLDWFPGTPLYKNPLEMSEVDFADRIYRLEGKAFGAVMAMPRWVFYDCAVLPGFVAGFAARQGDLSQEFKKALEVEHCDPSDWVPLSLFICIPTMIEGEWVAHNLCSANSLLPKEHRYYGLGFLTKAFGMWYANVRTCIGITQWGSPALKLHSHYGDFEIITAYTPLHTYANTLTYRLRVNPKSWLHFFNQEEDDLFLQRYKESGFEIHPQLHESMKSFQGRLEQGQGPYFLSAHEIRRSQLGEPLKVFGLR